MKFVLDLNSEKELRKLYKVTRDIEQKAKLNKLKRWKARKKNEKMNIEEGEETRFIYNLISLNMFNRKLNLYFHSLARDLR